MRIIIGPTATELSDLREDVQEMLVKHKEVFRYRLTDLGSDYGNERRFYVYEWFTKDEKKVFYVGKGTGDRFRHILWEMKKPKGIWYKKLHDNFGIDYRIVIDDLTNVEAEIYEVCLIQERCAEGEVLLQYADMPYNLEEYHSWKLALETRNFEPKIKVPDYYKRYFGVEENFAFDAVDPISLSKTHFLNADLLMGPYIEEEGGRIITYVENLGGKVYATLAKGATSVIEFGHLDYEKYMNLKERGYKVFHSLHVLEFIDDQVPTVLKGGRGKKRTVPKYDLDMHDKLKSFLGANSARIVEMASELKDDGFEAQMKGLDYAKNEDDFNAALFLEVSCLKGFEAPAGYWKLATIYRKYGLFADELRVVEAGIKNTGGSYRLFNRKRRIIEILDSKNGNQ